MDNDNDESTDESEKQGLGTSMAPWLVAGQMAPMESQMAFEINLNIDINSKALLDMISETDIMSATENLKATGFPATLKPTNPDKRISIAEAFDNW